MSSPDKSRQQYSRLDPKTRDLTHAQLVPRAEPSPLRVEGASQGSDQVGVQEYGGAGLIIGHQPSPALESCPPGEGPSSVSPPANLGQGPSLGHSPAQAVEAASSNTNSK